MINWIKKEYHAFKNSRTIKLSYAQKALAIVTIALEIMPATKGYMSIELFALLNGVLAVIANHLRKVTTKSLDDK